MDPVERAAAARRRLEDARAPDEPDGRPGSPDGGRVAEAEPRRWLVAFLGGHSQRGLWRLGRELRVVCVLGGAELDLRQAILEADEGVDHVRVRARRRAADRARGHRRLVFLGVGPRRAQRRARSGSRDPRFAEHQRAPVLAARRDRDRRRPERRASPAKRPTTALRIGTAPPFTDVRHGLFRWGGRWRFYSLEDRRAAITLELDGFTLGGRTVEAVVLGVDDPEDLECRLEAARPTPTE